MIQMILVHLVKEFEFKPVVKLEYGANIGVTYSPENCFIRIKTRN